MECVNDLHLQTIDKAFMGHLHVAGDEEQFHFYKHLERCFWPVTRSQALRIKAEPYAVLR